MDKAFLERLWACIAYDKDSGLCYWRFQKGNRKRGSICGSRHGNYINIQFDGVIYKAHRLIWFYKYGTWPEEIDHINGDGTDNRLSNLRLSSRTINMQNKRKAHKNSKTGFLGVAKQDGKYRAQICVDGKNKSLGMYDSPQEAHGAYIVAKRKLHQGNTL